MKKGVAHLRKVVLMTCVATLVTAFLSPHPASYLSQQYSGRGLMSPSTSSTPFHPLMIMKDGLSSDQRQLDIAAEVERVAFPEREPQILTDILPMLGPVDEKEQQRDENFMRIALEMAQQVGGERGLASAFPNPTVGAVLVSSDGRILGKGRSDYSTEAVQAAIEDAGLEVTPLMEWCVNFATSERLREDLASSTLYVTLEPSPLRRGTARPPTTQLIQEVGIPRVVIGCADPIADRALRGAAALHQAGVQVSLGHCLLEECQDLIQVYSRLANSKMHRLARQHFRQFGRPLGLLHCSVVDSDNVEAFARQGNAFGTKFGSDTLSFRNFGSYEIAPPPEAIWVNAEEDEDESYDEMGMELNMASVEFEQEDFQGDFANSSPMMPWYEQVDAIAATFPREGNGPPDDNSLAARLNGLKWLATYGDALPAGVERILVMDATDLKDLPMSNGNPNLPSHVDIEAFWRGVGRKPTRVLLRRGTNAQARAAADAAAAAAKAAAEAAAAATSAIESGDAARAAEAAIEFQKAAQAATEFIQQEVQNTQLIRRTLEEMGVVVESLRGGEPIDIMNHLGERNGYHTVVWRAGCWGERGVKSILAGAFQWVSAHLAVDAVGGKFWQLMLAENAVQAACGPVGKVKVFAEQEDISLEYCDAVGADEDCALTIGGRPVRHIRLDCRIALVDADRPREFVIAKTKPLDRKVIEEEAPWFL